ncbi:MAG: nucleotidyltransferase domain-containing protein [Promethearchaeati archaeon]
MPDNIQRDLYNKVKYSKKHWKLLEEKRKQAKKLLKLFKKNNLFPFVYGSVARGDVDQYSDIDIIFLHKIPTYKIDFILNQNNYENYRRELIMATPGDSIKLYIYLNELTAITIPLTKLYKTSLEFYDFGGKINYEHLINNERVPGIDKRLVLINPLPKGHEELSILNNESIAAKKVGVSIDTINERKRVLLRREEHGRTGVFLKRELSLEESPEAVLTKLARENSIIRRKIN